MKWTWSRKRAALVSAFILSACVLLIVTATWPRSMDEWLLFFPAKYPRGGDWTPGPGKLRFEDAWFQAEDGTPLHAWYCPCDQPRGTVLLAHGNGGNIASRADWLRFLQQEMRVTTLMFDYRGYGRSSGVPTVQGALQDARAARAKLCELAGVQPAGILLMGESLGGAIAVQLAAESAPRGLILQSTFSSLKDVARFHYPWLAWVVPAGKLDSTASISRYQGPLLLSHGDCDEVVPYELGRKLFDAAHEPKTLLTIRGAGHNNWGTKDYSVGLDRFISEVP